MVSLEYYFFQNLIENDLIWFPNFSFATAHDASHFGLLLRVFLLFSDCLIRSNKVLVILLITKNLILHDLLSIKLACILDWISNVSWLLQGYQILLKPIDRIHIWRIIVIDGGRLGLHILNHLILDEFILAEALS